MSSETHNNTLLKPWWLLLAITVPQLILGGIGYYAFTMIQSLLQAPALQLWKQYAIIFGVFGFGFTAYALVLSFQKKLVKPWISLVVFAVYLPLLYVLYTDFFYLFPRNVPNWMLDMDELTLQPNTFITPAYLYAMLVVVQWVTPRENAELRSWKQFGYALSIPLAWYVFANVVLPRSPSTPIAKHFFAIAFLLSTVVFLFFVWRGIVIWLRRYNEWNAAGRTTIPLLIVLIFPLLGLSLYNGVFSVGKVPEGIFGSLDHWLFYLLALVNGVLLLLPTPGNTKLKLGLFSARLVLLPFSLYFFVVFLPYLPLSVIAIVIVGLGFLMLTPLMVTAFHFKAIWDVLKELKGQVSTAMLGVVGVCSFLVIPFIIAFSLQQERATLHRALAYVFEHNSTRKEFVDISEPRLRRSLEMLASTQGRRRWMFSSSQRVPYLTAMYRWWVLDNLSVSNEKIQKLEHLFLDKPLRRKGHHRSRFQASRSVQMSLQPQKVEPAIARVNRFFKEPSLHFPVTPVKLVKVNSSTTFDNEAGAFRSQVDLVLHNPLKRSFQEYRTYIKLPDGVMLDSYYLYVGKKKVPGILVEKKSALWIYQQVTSRMKDPGLLAHIQGNWWELRVFPFAANETRKTGWTLLHKVPTSFQLGKQTVNLKPNQSQISGRDNNSSSFQESSVLKVRNSLYFSESAIKKLPGYQRKPYLHFLVDMSSKGTPFKKRYIRQIRRMKSKFAELAKHAEVTLMNYNISTMKLSEDWDQKIRQQPTRGGCFLERALMSNMVRHYKAKSKGYPIFVVLTSSVESCYMTKDFSHLRFLVPESDSFYVLAPNNLMSRYIHRLFPSLTLKSTLRSGVKINKPNTKKSSTRWFVSLDTLKSFPTQRHETVAWPNAKQPEYVVRKSKEAQILPLLSVNTKSSKQKRSLSKWEKGVALYGDWLAYEVGATRVSWLGLIRQSWKDSFLTPLTSFIVLENEAQYEALRRKQKAVLAGKSYMSASDSTTRMSEPGLLWLLALCGLLLLVQRRRKVEVV